MAVNNLLSSILLQSGGTVVWRVLANDGVALSTV